VVATARNDDHGGNLLRRLRIFTRALAEQARRHELPMELVLVEWNPPPDKPGLSEVLESFGNAFCPIRILTVPSEVHFRYRNANALPLYQMIGKNVGVRRASGEFILATNIDILLSDELMRFLAARELDAGRMYRIDRHDADAEVPAEAAVDEQLRYCRSHCIRINAKEGTFALDPEGFRRPAGVDIVAADAGICLDRGWYAPEQYFGRVFRWVGAESTIRMRPAPAAREMSLELSSESPLELHLWEHSVRVQGHCVVHIIVPPGTDVLSLSCPLSLARTLPDGRVVAFQCSRCAWNAAPRGDRLMPLSAIPARPHLMRRGSQVLRGAVRLLAEVRRGSEPRRVGLPIPAPVLDRLDVRRESANSASVAIGRSIAKDKTESWPPSLHTNACGDFTLLHRRHWTDLRGYPEFDLYSMNIDSLFCYMAHYSGAREQVLPEPMRIYHIEHASGSGWTPEGHRLLFDRLASKGIPWLEFEEVLGWARQMERLRTTMIFNGEDWGLASFDLPERVLGVD